MGSCITKVESQPQARLQEALHTVEYVIALQNAYTGPIAQPVRSRSMKAKSLVNLPDDDTPTANKSCDASKSIESAPGPGSGTPTKTLKEARDAGLSEAVETSQPSRLLQLKLESIATESGRVRRGSFQIGRATGTPREGGAATPGGAESSAKGSKGTAGPHGPLRQKTLMNALDVCAARTGDRDARNSSLRMNDRENSR